MAEVIYFRAWIAAQRLTPPSKGIGAFFIVRSFVHPFANAGAYYPAYLTISIHPFRLS